MLATMNLTKEAIQEFQKLYLAEYGVEMSFAEAKEQAQKFLSHFRVVVTPLSNDEH